MDCVWKEYVENACGIRENERILLAVSGGVDSMVMLHRFVTHGFPAGVAHCNFQLRGEDSDADEAFVRETAAHYGLPFFHIRFETTAYAETHGLSIEMAARELRYAWFREIAAQEGYRLIATAHHQDDAEETFFLNLMRGCGIRGLHGIQPLSGGIARPMGCFSRKEIEAYAEANHIPFRQDKTNGEDRFRRNHLRLHILPALRKLQPTFDQSLLKTMRILQKQENIYFLHIREISEKLLHADEDGYRLYWEEVGKLPYPETYLFEILHPFGFNESQITSLAAAGAQAKGKRLESRTHCLWMHGGMLLLRPLQTESPKTYSLGLTPEGLHTDCPFLKTGIHNGIPAFSGNPRMAFFDMDRLSFPLHIRYWRDGDRFVPFGMTGSKKLSDFFTGLHIDNASKKRIPLLCNGNGDILWIIGHRSDNRYRVRKDTARTLILEWNNA